MRAMHITASLRKASLAVSNNGKLMRAGVRIRLSPKKTFS
jgi:hypothetical protein